MDWPAKSQEFNLRENLWGSLARTVYDCCCQFDHIEELKKAVWETWNNIKTDTLQPPLQSMKLRCRDC